MSALRLVADGVTIDPSAQLSVDASRLLLSMSLLANLLLTNIQEREHLDRDALVH